MEGLRDVVSHFPGTVRRHGRSIVRIALPAVISFVCQFLFILITIAVVGHIASDVQAGVALGVMVVNLTGMVWLEGGLAALDTLGSQAYGAKNYPRVGIIWQRSLIITSGFYVISSLLWWFAGSWLRVLGMAPHLSDLAGQFTRPMVIGAPGVVFVTGARRFLAVQHVQSPFIVLAALGVVLTTVGLWFFLFHHHLRVLGAALSWAATQNAMALLLVVLLVTWRPHVQETWPGWSRECLKGWGEFIQLALPGAAMLGIEWGTYEIMTFVASHLGTVVVASHTIVATLVPLMGMLPLGFSVPAGVLVGNALGRGDPVDAQRLAFAFPALMFFSAGAAGTLLYTIQDPLISVFTSDPEVHRTTLSVLPLLPVFLLCDAVQVTLQGVSRGAGMQSKGAIIMGCLAVFVTLPASYIASRFLGFWGLWVGLTSSYALMASVLAGWVSRFDWRRLAEEAQQRSAPSGEIVDRDEEMDPLADPEY